MHQFIYQVFIGRPNQSHAPKRRIRWKMRVRKIECHCNFACQSRLQKSLKNHPKMVPRGTLGVPGGLPKASREAPRSRSGRFLRRHQDWRRIWSVPGVSRRPFWEPAGTQKSTKNRLVAKKVASEKVPRSVFHQFSVSSLFWVGFYIDFRWFSDVFLHDLL